MTHLLAKDGIVTLKEYRPMM